MIIQKSKTKLKTPILICAYPSIGMVGRYIVNYLISELSPEIYAEIDVQDYITLRNVIVENGIIYSPYIKEYIYYLHHKNNDFLFFFSDFEPSLNNLNKFNNDFVNFISQLKVSLIITFSGIPANILHTNKPKVFIATTENTKIMFDLNNPQIKKLEFGIIEGINGVVLEVAKENDIDGCCIISEVPFYTIDMNNPQCAKPILKLLSETFEFDINYEKIDRDIKSMDDYLRTTFSNINEQAQKLFSQLQNRPTKKFNLSQEEPSGITFEELKKQIKFALPESAKNKINELFKLAKENIDYAKKLKEELDRWGVYKEYEDKFLSLFLKNKKRKDKE